MGIRPTPWRSITALALAAAVLGPAHTPSAAERDPCNWRWRAGAERDLEPGRAPVVIGDSVMVEAVKPLARLGFRADARMCRMWPQGRGMVERMARDGRLPALVVMALGSNGPVPMQEIRRTLRSLEPGGTLALVTPRENGGGEGEDAETVRRAGRRYPKRVEVLDWVRYARGKNHWFGGDRLHLKREYANRYARCIKQVLARYRTPGHPCAPR